MRMRQNQIWVHLREIRSGASKQIDSSLINSITPEDFQIVLASTPIYQLATIQPILEKALGEPRLASFYQARVEQFQREHPKGMLDYKQQDTQQGRTLLHEAVVFNQPVHMTLLEQSNINATDINGDTPVHLAARYGRAEILKTLVQNKPEAVNKPNKAGETPLMAAVKRGDTQVITILVDAGADATYGMPSPSPLAIAIQQGDAAAITALIAKTGGNISLTSDYGMATKTETLLHAAVFCNELYVEPEQQLDVVKAIIKAGANVMETDWQGNTLLHQAVDTTHDTKEAQNGKNRSIGRLLDTGIADHTIQAINRRGFRPLHLAIARGCSDDILNVLAEQEMKMQVQGTKGLTRDQVRDKAKAEKVFLEKVRPVREEENVFFDTIHQYPRDSGFFHTHTRQARVQYLEEKILRPNIDDSREDVAVRKEKYNTLLKELFLQYRSIDDSRSTLSLDIERSLLNLLNLYPILHLQGVYEKRDAFSNLVSTFFKHAMHGMFGYRHDKKDDPVYKLIKTAMKDEIPELFDKQGKLKGENKDHYKQLVAIDEKETAFFFSDKDIKPEDFITQKPS